MSVDERRRALIESAFRVIADHGVEGATTRRICAHAGMPLASFHYAFESRTALLSAVMETAVPTDITEMLQSVMHDSGGDDSDNKRLGMQENMERQLTTFYDLVKADPGRTQATISLGIYAHNHPELQSFGKRMYQKQFEIASVALQSAAERSGVHWLAPVETLGPIVIAGTNSITLIYLSTADDEVIRTVITAVVRSLMTYVAED
jgi:AcrR family transcriptional regulator